jgi:hypothetical protein
MIRLCFFSLILLISCSMTTPKLGSQDSDQALAERLLAMDYHAILLPGTAEADALWADGVHADALVRLARDAERPMRVRLFALEVYRIRRDALPEGFTVQAAMPLYIYALTQTPWEDSDLGISGNDWGMLAYLDRQGYTGAGGLTQRTLSLGPDLVPLLRPLLDDSRLVQYAGSRDATTGNMLAYQVRDVTAYLIQRLLGEMPDYHPERADRDRLIAVLRERVGEK